ncbi:DUF2894 domain-containing protein [Pandoraea pneumonica]|uniref:DUF2894 domain-containing protein n=1 Tax=Pandoraea pneumonica TaxID=2508299 RepID=UPI003CF28EC1
MADDPRDLSETLTPPEASVWQTQLDGWRAQQADRRDPVRFHLIETLARRAATFTGETRRVLDERLQVLADAFAKTLAEREAPPPAEENPATPHSVPNAAVPSPLSLLIADMTRRVGERPAQATPAVKRAAQPSPTATARQAGAAAPAASIPPPTTPTVISTGDSFEDMDVLEYFRETWSKLSTDGNLRQSLAQVPENAGPLNSSHLVHRALSLMHDVSPDYLRHFLRHADALSWLEDMDTAGAMRNKSAARVAASAKPSRAKAR